MIACTRRLSPAACGVPQVRLDNQQALRLHAENTLAVYVNPSQGDEGGPQKGSGWWYEGGGLYRHVSLIQAHPVHIEQAPATC